VPALGAGSTAARVAVVYPQVRDPYRAVFRAIVDGINAETTQGAEVFEIAPEETIEAVTARLAERQLDAVVLLGKRSATTSKVPSGGSWARYSPSPATSPRA